jgi:hypothetical protein
MKAVVYSLWGNNPRYTDNAIRCAKIWKQSGTNWEPVFFVGIDVSDQIKSKLIAEGGKVLESPRNVKNPLFWRFAFRDCERFIVRDTDSLPCSRDLNAIQLWEKSGMTFHVIRDHPHHTNPMMGGLWGAVVSEIPKTVKFDCSKPRSMDIREIYNSDQRFLSSHVWPKIRSRTFQQDFCTRHLFPDAEPFPAPFPDNNDGWRFCGEVYDETGNPRSFDWEMRVNWMTNGNR